MKIRGRTVGTPMPRSDWSQTDPRKANYILNKPDGIVCEASGSVVSVCDSSNQKLHNLTLYGKTTQNGTPTPENPVELVSAGASGAINTKVCGGNLYDHSKDTAMHRVNTSTGEIEYSGGDQSASEYIRVKPNTAYTLNFTYLSTAHYGMAFYNQDKVFISGRHQSDGGASSALPFTFTTPANCAYLRFSTAPAVRVPDAVVLNKGSVALTFEPYNGQTLTASTPNGLPGVPLGATIPSFIKANDALMPGVWWDEETQQYYLSDTKDYARGVYVQRVALTAITTCDYFEKSANIAYCNLVYYPVRSKSFNVLSEKFINDRNGFNNRVAGTFTASTTNSGDWSDYMRALLILPAGVATTRSEATAWLKEQGVAVLHPLYEPIETALSDEELTDYAALHTNKPNTTVYNDAGAGLKLEYVADTKTYIDNKFTELQNAILSAGANI